MTIFLIEIETEDFFAPLPSYYSTVSIDKVLKL